MLSPSDLIHFLRLCPCVSAVEMIGSSFFHGCIVGKSAVTLCFLIISLQHLAHYASENLEAMNPPLFLRFLNLLMNDAVFLLDEAIQVRLCN